MKKCVNCLTVKIIAEFGKSKQAKDGAQSKCKVCHNDYALNRSRSKEGLAARIYNGQKRRSIECGIEKPAYTLPKLRQWLLFQDNFDSLYNQWVNSEFNKWFAPSVDRIDDYKIYSFDNIQLMSWRENYEKGNKDRFDCKNNKKNVAVNQFGKNGEFIEKHHSLHSAGRKTGMSFQAIWNCCNDKNLTAGGYRWQYS